MCELFGVCAKDSFRVNEFLEAFYSHSAAHPDGWGLAVFRRLGVSLEKEASRAIDSRYLHQRLSRDIIAADMLAHIRKATIGRIEYANCHPFIWDDTSGRSWTLIHNGTIFNGQLIAPYLQRQEGTTDSERLLLYIVDKINQLYENVGVATELERFRVIDDVVCSLSGGNKLNLILFDGEVMYVHSNCVGTLHLLEEPDRVIFATVPVSFGDWQPLRQNCLLAYKHGQNILTGTAHPNTFIESEHDMTSLMATFAEL